MSTLVLLPGMDGTGLLFAPLVEALGDGGAVQVVTYPSMPSDTYAALERVAESQLPKDGPLVLLGESFSGPIAIALAARYPQRVVGLILCCTFARTPYPRLAWLRWLARLMPVKEASQWMASPVLLGRFASPALRQGLGRALAGVSPAALATRLEAVLSVDVTSDLRRLDIPILDLRASEDRVIPRGASDVIRACQPGVRALQLVGPHGLLQAAPIASACAIRDFLGMVG